MAAQQRDLTYHTVAPCVFVDTRVAVGAFAAGETRTYNVVGSGSFAGQGGAPAGCGGIANAGGSGSRPVLKRIVIHAAGGSAQNYGIYNDQASSPREVRDVEAEASGGNSAYGFYVSVDVIGLDFRITASTFTATGATADHYAVFFSGGDELEVESSQLRASGGAASYGLYSPSPSAGLNVDASQITGATETVHGFLQVRIGASRLNGGPVANGTKCAGVYDESYTFFAGPACP